MRDLENNNKYIMAENENTNNQEETKVNDPVPENENPIKQVKTDKESDKEAPSEEF